jgi:HK97 family phage major capsid protein
MQHLTKHALRGSVAITRKGEEDDPVGIVTKALEDLQKTVDDRLKKVEEKTAKITPDPKDEKDKVDLKALTDRLDAVEKKANRPVGAKDKDEQTEEAKIEHKAFGTYLRLGSGAPADELKALTISNDTQGGYLAPAEMSTEMIRDLVEFSPIRSVASVRSIASPSVKYPKRTGITNAQWEGEGEDSEESTVTFGQAEVPADKLMTYVDISNELLADSGGTAEAEVRLALAEDFGKKEGTAFVNGTGSKQPEGIMANADITSYLNGHATDVKADALIKLLISAES